MKKQTEACGLSLLLAIVSVSLVQCERADRVEFSSPVSNDSFPSNEYAAVTWRQTQDSDDLNLVQGAQISLIGQLGGGTACWGVGSKSNSQSLDNLKVRIGALGCEICIEKVTIKDPNSRTLSISPNSTLCNQGETAFFSSSTSSTNRVVASVSYTSALDKTVAVPAIVSLALDIKTLSGSGVEASTLECLPGSQETQTSYNIGAETIENPNLKCTEITSTRECSNGRFGNWAPSAPTTHKSCTPLPPPPQLCSSGGACVSICGKQVQFTNFKGVNTGGLTTISGREAVVDLRSDANRVASVTVKADASCNISVSLRSGYPFMCHNHSINRCEAMKYLNNEPLSWNCFSPIYYSIDGASRIKVPHSGYGLYTYDDGEGRPCKPKAACVVRGQSGAVHYSETQSLDGCVAACASFADRENRSCTFDDRINTRL